MLLHNIEVKAGLCVNRNLYKEDLTQVLIYPKGSIGYKTWLQRESKYYTCNFQNIDSVNFESYFILCVLLKFWHELKIPNMIQNKMLMTVCYFSNSRSSLNLRRILLS